MSSIAIVGKSGEGKSTSIGEIPSLGITGLNPIETVLINVLSKDLPFKGSNKLYKGKLSEGGNLLETNIAKDITEAIKYINEKRPEIKNLVIDDAQSIMALEFMSRAKETGYNKFTDMGVSITNIIKAAKDTRKDLKVFFIWHSEDNKEYGFKMKTIGNMLDQYLTLEGLFTVILYSKVSKGNDSKIQYQFVTNNDGQYPSKSPYGMFSDLYIKNDLGLVAQKIDEYYS